MIPAVEALKLSCAQLTPEESAAVGKLETEIEEHIRKSMARRGCEFDTKETNGNVISEVNQRLKAVGYNPQWQPLIQRHKLNAATQEHIGFRLTLAPNDESYRSAARADLS
jgi:hypothetical protein